MRHVVGSLVRMEDFLNSLPGPWRDTLQALFLLITGILTAVGVFSGSLAALKPILVKLIGEPSDTAPGWKRGIWSVVAFLEKVAAWNTRTVQDRKERAALNNVQSIPPYQAGGDL